MDKKTENSRFQQWTQRGRDYKKTASDSFAKRIDRLAYAIGGVLEKMLRPYERMEQALDHRAESCREAWKRCGRPHSLLRWFVYLLRALPVDVAYYLVYMVVCYLDTPVDNAGHGLRHIPDFHFYWFLLWIVFTASMRTIHFWYREIFPNHKVGKQSGAGKNELTA